MPVDPSNLLLTGSFDGKPVLGLPGCAKSPKYNGFDMVPGGSPRLPVGRSEIVRMGSGGLLAEIPSRPQPRDETDADDTGPQQAPRVAVLVLAAGRSTRMGGPNKLFGRRPKGAAAGRPCGEGNARTPQAVEVVVVLGRMADDVRAAVEKAVPPALARALRHPIRISPKAFSTSVRTGIGALPTTVDAADEPSLGDMPGVGAPLFNPVDGGVQQPCRRPRDLRADGRRQARQVRPVGAALPYRDGRKLSGDGGAGHLIGEHADLVCESRDDG